MKSATLNRASVPRYDKLELTLDLAATYDNPFDPDDVDVHAVFTSPQRETIRVNGFLYQEHARRLDGQTEKIEAAGEPVWKVRFAPDVAGAWRYRIFARNRSGTVSLPEARFTVTASSNPGFVQRSRKNPRVFAFNDASGNASGDAGGRERPFFLVGENMGWAGGRGSFEFDQWLGALGKSGGNWMRIWMSSWNCALEWSRESKGDWRNGGYHGVGVYSLDNAWKLDAILDAATRHGVYVMLCFGTYGEFRDGGFFNEGQWKANPYNVANGGPCQKPEDFWTNQQARKLYRQRLRYIAARYGYRSGIQAWEFWNEAEAPAAWVGEMARYLKGTGEFKGDGKYSVESADPYRHLISTTYGNDAVWKLPEIDFTMTHNYGDTGSIADHAPVIGDDARRHALYNKPHLMAEFGIDWRASDEKYDPEGKGVNFHNGLWSSAMSGNAGGAMIWWWDNYVHPKKLYAPFGALRRFSDTVNWAAGEWKPLTMDAPRVSEGPQTWTDLVLPANSGWGKAAASAFTITQFGVEGNQLLPQHLYSPGKADMRTTPTFRVRFEQPGRFAIHVNSVADKNKIQFLLDGKVAREITLSAVPPADPNVKPEYESTELKKEWNQYQARFDKEYGINVPAGEHTITLANVAGDWVGLDSITLGGYRSSRYPAVNTYGMMQGRNAVLWIQNAEHNWKNVAERKPIPVIRNAVMTLRDLPAGRYTVEWWDTWRGQIMKREAVNGKNGALQLHLPEIATDIAARLIPASAR